MKQKNLISKVNDKLMNVIEKVEENEMSNQSAQTIINASAAIFKGLMVEVNQKRFVNKK